jgi:cysteinyl-tRNA synthetase
VTYARNITDVDDKIIAVARSGGVSCHAITTRFTDAYHADLAALDVAPHDMESRARPRISPR